MAKTYEELIAITGGRVEPMDEAVRMLTQREAGKKTFWKIHDLYAEFAETGNMETFEEISTMLQEITGYRI